MNKSLKLIVFCGLLLAGILSYLIYQNYIRSNESEKKFTKFNSQKFDEKPISSDKIDIDLDSIFHQEICFDYKNVWISHKKDKVVLFEYNSGKLLVYKNLNKDSDVSNLSKIPADNVFSWNFHERRKDNKIIGVIDDRQKDTLMFWIYNKEKENLIDDKGLIFEKIDLKK